MGGVSRHKSTQPKNDIFFHPFVAKKLIENLSVHFNNPKKVLDACCGDGALGIAIEHCVGSKVDYVDINNRPQFEKAIVCDILNWKPQYKYDLIVCNPPWIPVKAPLRIYWHLVSLLNEHGVLIYIINNTFCYQGAERGRTLRYQKHYELPRYTFMSAGIGLVDCGVMVYHKNNIVPVTKDCFIYLPKVRDKLQYSVMEKEIQPNLFSV
jgi:hypothetical protein